MYLAALHVISPANGQEGVNAFYYRHAGPDWIVPPNAVPDEDPGELVKKDVAVPPGGNRVRSYLDIIAPDTASWPEIRGNFLAFVLDTESQPFPWNGVVGRCRFRAGIEDGLAAAWRSELGALYGAARKVRP